MSFTSITQQKAQRPSNETAFNFIAANLVRCTIAVNGEGQGDAFDSELKPEKCESIEELLTALIPKLNLPPSAVECFHILVATVIGLKLNGPLLWTHCVGPSSGLKTTLLYMLAAAQDKCFMLSHFSGLYSGYKGEVDTSVVPLIQGKTLIIPDLTPLLRADKPKQDEVFGDMRDIYDGKGKKVFKNGVVRDYKNVRFACITGVTNEIYQCQSTDLGERFSMAEINAYWTENGRRVEEKIDTSGDGNAFNSVLNNIASGLSAEVDEPISLDDLAPERSMCWGLLTHLSEWMSEESGNLAALAQSTGKDIQFKAEIEALAIWLEYARCPVPNKNKDKVVTQRPALPHRSIKIITKYAICLCIVAKTTVLTSAVKSRVRKLAFDTGSNKVLEIMNMLATAPVPQAKIDIALAMNLSPTWIAYLCDHLQTLGVVHLTQDSNNSGRRGTNANYYDLTPDFRRYATTIGLVKDRIRGVVYTPPKPISLSQAIAAKAALSVGHGSTTSSPTDNQLPTTPTNGHTPSFSNIFAKMREQNNNGK